MPEMKLHEKIYPTDNLIGGTEARLKAEEYYKGEPRDEELELNESAYPTHPARRKHPPAALPSGVKQNGVPDVIQRKDLSDLPAATFNNHVLYYRVITLREHILSFMAEIGIPVSIMEISIGLYRTGRISTRVSNVSAAIASLTNKRDVWESVHGTGYGKERLYLLPPYPYAEAEYAIRRVDKKSGKVYYIYMDPKTQQLL